MQVEWRPEVISTSLIGTPSEMRVCRQVYGGDPVEFRRALRTIRTPLGRYVIMALVITYHTQYWWLSTTSYTDTVQGSCPWRVVHTRTTPLTFVHWFTVSRTQPHPQHGLVGSQWYVHCSGFRSVFLDHEHMWSTSCRMRLTECTPCFECTSPVPGIIHPSFLACYVRSSLFGNVAAITTERPISIVG